ncbi:MAG: hypothetical protein JRN15_10655 [Nitrososphaerota archaeon]|nr:hypothetical protein [Nitrososphaerota archaeon]
MEALRETDKNQPESMIQPNVFLEADRILHFAREQKIIIRLLGGVGVWFSSPSASKPTYARHYHDLDFVGLRKQGRNIEALFENLGYKTKGLFNKLQGDTRLLFIDEKNGRRIDIFLDKFVMCHEFDFKDRLELRDRALSPADLLVTKLQIVEINKKDITDLIALILDNSLSDEKNPKGSVIEKQRIVSLASNDWGVWKTLTMNIDKILAMLPELNVPETDQKIVGQRLVELKSAIDASPKSFSWKMRAKVGDKVKWYVLPESP